MPVVYIPKSVIAAGLNEPTLKDEDFTELCFSFGIELDDVAEEGGVVMYKIEIPANRYDLLCPEGLLRALCVFRGLSEVPNYRVIVPSSPLVMNVHAKTQEIRPFVVCGVLRNIHFTQERYQSFIELQEKLHQNICRKRTLVAIGTHDLDTIEGPFSYEALPPKDIRFVPLKHTQEYDGAGIMTLYESDTHMRGFLPIIRDSPVYPVIYDAKRRVLSLPPIINSAHSRITVDTRNVFIECTATDLTKARIVLNTIIAMFSEYCAEPFTCEAVDVRMPDGSAARYPQLDPYDIAVSVPYINESLGLALSEAEVVALLRRMQLPAVPAGGGALTIKVPCTRSDVLHGCDVMEDAAIAYGFDRIRREIPPTLSVGQQHPLNKISDLLRLEMAQCGYTEILTFALTSREDNFARLRITDPAQLAQVAVVSNPKSSECEIARTNLVSGLLKTLSNNRSLPLPVQLFEVSDVVLLDSTADTGARNERRLSASFSGTASGLEFVHGLLDRLMLLLDVPCDAKLGYSIRPFESDTYLSGRGAEVLYRGAVIGTLGVLHPRVLLNFGLRAPTSVLEICIEPFA